MKTTRVWCRIDDEGRPLEFGVQTQDSNRPVLLWFKRSWW
jgi:hypothetical protein